MIVIARSPATWQSVSTFERAIESVGIALPTKISFRIGDYCHVVGLLAMTAYAEIPDTCQQRQREQYLDGTPECPNAWNLPPMAWS